MGSCYSECASQVCSQWSPRPSGVWRLASGVSAFPRPSAFRAALPSTHACHRCWGRSSAG